MSPPFREIMPVLLVSLLAAIFHVPAWVTNIPSWRCVVSVGSYAPATGHVVCHRACLGHVSVDLGLLRRTTHLQLVGVPALA